jgi:phage antirepressor YoqD-like protein
MKFLSTTALAKKNNIEPQELFKTLSDNDWMYKKDGNWILTKNGRMSSR